MSTFDRIIGYDHIKAELMQISDMIHHPVVYAALDAKLPQGLLLSGEVGRAHRLLGLLPHSPSLLHVSNLSRSIDSGPPIGPNQQNMPCSGICPALDTLNIGILMAFWESRSRGRLP